MPMLLNLTSLQEFDGAEITTNAQDLAFLQTVLSEHLLSPKIKEYDVADAYYRNRNIRIKEKTRFIYIEEKKQIVHTLANTQSAHAFMKKLVNQKASYLLGKPFSVSTEQAPLEEELSEIFNKAFYRKILKVGKDAIKYGLGWLQVYYDEQGNLNFKRIPIREIIPFWKDTDRTELEALMRTYTIVDYGTGGKKSEIRKVEYYDKTGVYYFKIENDKLVADPDKETVFEGHFSVKKTVVVGQDAEGNDITKEIEEAQAWQQIPFIAFKFNDDELGILTFIKDLIDDYDKNNSDVSDQLQDTPNAIKVVKGYNGESKEEFAHNINIYRTIFIDDGGEVSAVQTTIDIQALNSHLERLRKDIYEFGGGVDSQRDTQNMASGVALKFRYADLDLDAKFMSTEFSASMERLLWFVCADLEGRGEGEFDPEEVDIVWNTDMAQAEGEVIDNINKSASLLSRETLLANHPWVANVEEEIQKMQRQKEADAKEFGNIDSGTLPQDNNIADDSQNNIQGE